MKKSVDNFFDEFFNFFSKIVLFIPIFILVFGLILKFSQVLPSPTPVEKKDSSSRITLNLDGPLICLSSSKESTISAYVKDKQVFVEKKENSKANLYLLKSDCLYIWQKDSSVGEKICGLTPYLSILFTFPSFDLLNNFDHILPLMTRMTGKSLPSTSSATIGTLVKSCRKEEIKDLTVFKIPKKIIFTTK